MLWFKAQQMFVLYPTSVPMTVQILIKIELAADRFIILICLPWWW